MNLRELVQSRIDAGESQTAIAKRAGVSQATIHKILYTETAQTVETIKKFSTAYRVQLADIVTTDYDNHVAESVDKYRQAGINEPLIIQIVGAIEEYLEATDSEMPADRKGKLICLLYEEFKEEKKLNPERALRLIRVAA